MSNFAVPLTKRNHRPRAGLDDGARRAIHIRGGLSLATWAHHRNLGGYVPTVHNPLAKGGGGSRRSVELNVPEVYMRAPNPKRIASWGSSHHVSKWRGG